MNSADQCTCGHTMRREDRGIDGPTWVCDSCGASRPCHDGFTDPNCDEPDRFDDAGDAGLAGQPLVRREPLPLSLVESALSLREELYRISPQAEQYLQTVGAMTARVDGMQRSLDAESQRRQGIFDAIAAHERGQCDEQEWTRKSASTLGL